MIDATDIKADPTASTLNKGGMASKIHGICHSKAGPLWLHLREGQCSDFTGADGVLKDLPSAATVMGDQGYDRGKIRKMLSQQGILPYIRPVTATRNPCITARGWIARVTKSKRSFPD